jgi:vitamin B12 transporter
MKRIRAVSLLFCVFMIFGGALTARAEVSDASPSASSAGHRNEAPKKKSRSAAGNRQKSQTRAVPAVSKPATALASAAPGDPPVSPSGKSSKARNQTSASKLPPMVIVVTATAIEQPLSTVGTTTSVVSGQQVRSQEIQSAGEALREVPGLVVTQSGSLGTVTDVSIRGASPSQTLIMIDGVEVNTSATGSFDLANMTTDDLDRIEVVRGAGGSLYGSQAMGGVINLITREGSGPPRFSLLSAGGNRATQRQVLTADGAEGRLAYSGALSYFSTSGFRVVNDSSDNLSGALRLDYHLDPDTTLRGFARYSRSNVSLANYSNYVEAVDPNAHQRGEFMLFKGEIDRYFGPRLETQLSSFFVRNDLRLNDLPEPANPTSEVDRIPDEIRGADLLARYDWGNGIRSVAGFDFKDRWLRSLSEFTSFFPPPPPFRSVSLFRARRQEYAGYVEQEGRFLNGLVLATAGLRVDGNSQFGKELSPSWSVAIPIESLGLTLRGSYSEGFRAPSFDELYFPSFGNPDLQPEISSEYDGGFTKTFGEAVSFTATYFSRRIHNLIVAVPCPTCLYGSQAGNAGRVDTQGVEIVPALHPMRGLSLSGSLTILDQTHVSPSPDIRPIRVPKYSAWAFVLYTRTGIWGDGDRATASLAYSFVGDRDDIEPSGVIRSHDAYHLVDAVLSYDPGMSWRAVRDEQAFVRLQNLLDRHYSQAFGFPAPPFNFVAGVRVEF